MTTQTSLAQPLPRTRRLTLGLGLIALLAACGDDEASTSGQGGSGGGAPTSTTAASTSVSSVSGATTAASTTGAGGAPDSASSGGGAGEGGAGDGGAGDGGAGGAGGAGGSAPLEPGFAVLDFAMAIDLTSDGRIALLQDAQSIEGDVYFYDVAADEPTYATSVGDALADFATGLSDDRRITALHGIPVEAGIWSEADDWTDIETPFFEGCDINVGGAWDISRDGNVAVGFFWNQCSPQAFLFTGSDDGGDLTMLDVLGAPFDGADRPASNRATVVSDDGRIAAGFAENDVLDRSAAVWSDDGSGFLLDPDNQDAPSEILSISSDGSVLGGIIGWDAFRWTEESGIAILPRLETAFPQDPMFVNAVAAEGDLLFGGSGDAFSGVPVAFVWTEDAGTRALQGIVAAAGIELPEGFLLCSVLASSADGSVLLGTGFDADFATQSFVLRMPVEAYAE